MRYRNVYRFSDQVPETAHDGHRIEVMRQITDCDIEVGPMYRVRCLDCGEEFDTFAEEIEQGQEPTVS